MRSITLEELISENVYEEDICTITLDKGCVYDLTIGIVVAEILDDGLILTTTKLLPYQNFKNAFNFNNIKEKFENALKYPIHEFGLFSKNEVFGNDQIWLFKHGYTTCHDYNTSKGFSYWWLTDGVVDRMGYYQKNYRDMAGLRPKIVIKRK